MKTINLHVGELLSPLGALGVEKQLSKLDGVKAAAVNQVSGSATLTYDESKISSADIAIAIEQCGHHCAGELSPSHLCEPRSLSSKLSPTRADTGIGKQDHAAMRQGAPASDAARSPAVDHKPHGGENKDAMAAEMGHGSGVDMQSMVLDMRNRFFIALGFTVPIFFLSPMGMDSIKISPPFGLRLDLVLFVLASGAIVYPVWPFLVAAYRALRNGVANMAVLVVLSVGTGYLFSVGSTFIYGGEQFYEAAALLLVFILLGHWLEMRARAGASEAIRALMDLAPPKANVLRDGKEVEVPTAEIIAGETVVIRPGNKIRSMGQLPKARLWLMSRCLRANRCRLIKRVGDAVIGATINKSGTFQYRATKVGADTALAQIVKLVRKHKTPRRRRNS